MFRTCRSGTGGVVYDRASGLPIPSPTIMEKKGTAFRKAVDRFAAAHMIPVVRFGKDDRKIEVMHRYLAKRAKTGRAGVTAIGWRRSSRRCSPART
jgi:hypothetical protein